MLSVFHHAVVGTKNLSEKKIALHTTDRIRTTRLYSDIFRPADGVIFRLLIFTLLTT